MYNKNKNIMNNINPIEKTKKLLVEELQQDIPKLNGEDLLTTDLKQKPIDIWESSAAKIREIALLNSNNKSKLTKN